jgi:hypothetical protein
MLRNVLNFLRIDDKKFMKDGVQYFEKIYQQLKENEYVRQ